MRSTRLDASRVASECPCACIHCCHFVCSLLVRSSHDFTRAAKRPLLPKQVWAIRARLELANNLRDLALFNVAIDSKLRGCDLVRLSVVDLVKEDRVGERVSVIQSKTKRPVQFELTETGSFQGEGTDLLSMEVVVRVEDQ